MYTMLMHAHFAIASTASPCICAPAPPAAPAAGVDDAAREVPRFFVGCRRSLWDPVGMCVVISVAHHFYIFSFLFYGGGVPGVQCGGNCATNRVDTYTNGRRLLLLYHLLQQQQVMYLLPLQLPQQMQLWQQIQVLCWHQH